MNILSKPIYLIKVCAGKYMCADVPQSLQHKLPVNLVNPYKESSQNELGW